MKNRLVNKFDIMTDIIQQRVVDLHKYNANAAEENEMNEPAFYEHLIVVHQNVQPKLDREHYIKLAALCIGAIDAMEK